MPAKFEGNAFARSVGSCPPKYWMPTAAKIAIKGIAIATTMEIALTALSLPPNIFTIKAANIGMTTINGIR